MNAENLKIENLKRVSVVGMSCSGKSTFAKRLAEILNSEHVEIDALNFLPGWAERPRDEFFDAIARAADRRRWVFDGNYTRTRELIWGRATAIVWLDYSFPRTFYRALKRTVSRAYTGEPICGDNRETFRMSFMSRESILLWVLTGYLEKRRRYTKLFGAGNLGDKNVYIFRHPAETEDFLRRVEQLCK